MQTTQGYSVQSVRSTQGFIVRYAELIPGVFDSGARRRLDELLVEILGYETEQAQLEILARGETQNRRRLQRVLLRDHVKPIICAARIAARQTVALGALRMPAPRLKPMKLVGLARAIADQAGGHAEVFTAAGLQEDFVARLHGAADALEESLVLRISLLGERRKATLGLNVKLREAREVVHLLDALVRSAIPDDAALLASWYVAQRVPRVGSGRSPATTALAVPGAARMLPAPNVQMLPAPNVQMLPASNVQMLPAPNVQMLPAPNVQMLPAPIAALRIAAGAPAEFAGRKLRAFFRRFISAPPPNSGERRSDSPPPD